MLLVDVSHMKNKQIYTTKHVFHPGAAKALKGVDLPRARRLLLNCTEKPLAEGLSSLELSIRGAFGDKDLDHSSILTRALQLPQRHARNQESYRSLQSMTAR